MIRKICCIVTVLLFSVSLFSLVLTVLPASVGAATLYVGGVGPGNYTTIQSAVNAANPGDTIYVYGGTYYENVVIDRTLSLIGEDSDTTVIDGGSNGDVIHVSADWVNVTGFNVTNSGLLPDSGGIDLYYAENCSVTGNMAFDNHQGIGLEFSHNNTIAENSIRDTGFGVDSFRSHRNLILDNIFNDNSFDIYLSQSDDTTVIGNYIEGGHGGITIHLSANDTFLNNTMVGVGIYLMGGTLEYINTHTIDTSNTVNGKPVYYWKDAIGGMVPPNAGQVILANCQDVMVENQTISNVTVGISLGASSGVIITNNTVTSNHRYGIVLAGSGYNWISNNTFSMNYNAGIALWGSSHNRIENNTASGSRERGIILSSSGYNTLINNTVSWNDKEGIIVHSTSRNVFTYNTFFSNSRQGIRLDSCGNNSIHHNNFMNNTDHAYDERNSTWWHDGYPSGGNYYDNYSGIDQYSGPNQDQPGSDDIGDTPYNISGGMNQDKYPLMSPAVLPPIPPSAPRNLQAVAGLEHINLTWETPTIDWGSAVTNYRIYQGTVPDGEVYLVEIGNVLNYTDTGLTNGQAYYYEVTAVTGGGEGAKSNEATATPGDVPGPPAGLDATAGNEQVTLTWLPPIDDGGTAITSYTIYRGTSSGTWTHLQEIGNVLTHTDAGLTNGQIYYYRVSAKNAVGEGSKSIEISSIPGAEPGPPVNLVALAGKRNVTLTWSSPLDDGGFPVTSYNVYRGTSSGEEVFLTALGNNLEYVDTGLTAGTEYFYRVSAINSIGEGVQSNEASAVPTGPHENQPPVCRMSSPIQGATVAEVQTISGTASDPDGIVQKVEIKIDNGAWFEAIGITSWTFEWITTDVSNGEHTIYARSFDGENYSTVANVTVVVDNPDPPTDDGSQDGWLWLALAVIIVIAVVVLLTVLMLIRRRKKSPEEEEPSEPPPQEPL